MCRTHSRRVYFYSLLDISFLLSSLIGIFSPTAPVSSIKFSFGTPIIPHHSAKTGIDKWEKSARMIENKTVEAEITVAMLSQRVRDAENRAENKPSNGPLRVQ